MSPITDVVSLGYNCRTTRRVRDYFGTEEAYPFDWWVSPMKGLIGVLLEWDVDRLYDPAVLAEVRSGEQIAYLRHGRYGIKFMHDFPSDQGRVRPNWREHLPEAKSRMTHLMAKFDALNSPDRKVLFYREVGPSDRAVLEHCKGLRRLVLAHTPLAQCNFLLISSTGIKAPRWTSLSINDPLEEPWSGDPEIWDSALASLGYTLSPEEKVPETTSNTGRDVGERPEPLTQSGQRPDLLLRE